MTHFARKLSLARALVAAAVLLELGGSLVGRPLAFPTAAAAKKKKDKGAAKTEAAAAPADAVANEADPDGKKPTPAVVDPKAGAKKAAAAAPADEALRTSGPAQLKVPLAEKNFDNSAKADKKRDEQIAEIQAILPKVKGQQKGELVFRLAEAYWEKSKFMLGVEMKDFNVVYDKWVDEGRQGKEPQLSGYTKKSDAYKKQSLANYKVVLEQFPDYPRLDEVLYIMAYNEYEAGRSKEAIDNYSQLIRQYPKSEYVSDSYLALGEHYFKSNDLTKATKAYGKAYSIGREVKRPGVYRYAQYKLAWCDYNAQQYDDALKKFMGVVEGSEQAENTAAAPAGSRQSDNVRLKREALNDMVLTYSQLDQTKEAYAYLKKKAGGEQAYRLTAKLGAIYKEQGKHALEIDTLRMLINLEPDNPQCPDFQSSIVAAYSQLGDRDAVRKEVTRMVELYAPGQSWWRKNENNKASVERARAVAENRMRELVTDYHRYAQKFKKVDDYLVARDIYSQYLKAFPDSDSAYRLNFYYAELLWDIGDWRQAAIQYDAVVKRDPKGEYTRACAYNAVLAWEKIVKGEAPPQFANGVIRDTQGKKKDGKIAQDRVALTKLEKGKAYDAEKIPEDEVNLANACDAYVAVVPENVSAGNKELTDELIKVKFKAAYIFHRHNHFDDGAKRFGELIDRWPSSDFARQSADIILDSYDAREQWDNLEKWSRTFAKNKQLMGDEKFAKSVSKFMEGSTFKSIALANEKAKSLEKSQPDQAKVLFTEAGERFEKFVDEFPKSEYAPIALYNSTLIYAGADKIDLAIRAADKLLSEYAATLKEGKNLENKLEETTLLNLAAYHEKVANYRVAADTYTRFVDKFKDSPKAPDSLYNAGVFYLGLGDTKAAVTSFARYIKDYSKQKDVPEVYLRMAAVYEDQEDWKRASALYGEFEKLYGKDAKPEQVLASRYKTALALQKAGRDKEMNDVCAAIVESWKRLDAAVKSSPTGQLAGGYCGFQVLEGEFAAYKAIKIESKPGQAPKKVLLAVKEALDTKLRRRDEIAKKYLGILEYGNGEWGVAGLSRAADSLLDYVKTLRDAPDPPSLQNNPEALDLFRTELENIAFPVEDQGIQAMEKALDKAFELGIYSQYTLEIEDKLRTYKPARFGHVYELPFFPTAAVAGGPQTAAR